MMESSVFEMGWEAPPSDVVAPRLDRARLRYRR